MKRFGIDFLRIVLALFFIAPALFIVFAPLAICLEPPQTRIWAEFRAIDRETGLGVPLVELETVNGLSFVTDNAGRVAFHEPGLMDREIFLNVRSHGYSYPRDGFGFAGLKVTPRAGAMTEIPLQRVNVAERLCRLTGEGRFRDSVLLGHMKPAEDTTLGGVAGQDSVQARRYRGKVYWFWGDTQRLGYPLGLFRVSGAVTPDPASSEQFDLSRGLPFQYWIDSSGFSRAMFPLADRPEGVIWIDSLFTVKDEEQNEKLVAHYSRRKNLAEELEQGIAVFNDAREVFEPVVTLPLDERWRKPAGHPIEYEDGGSRWLLFGSPNPNVRVPANYRDVLNPQKYQAWTCAKELSSDDAPALDLDDSGRPKYRWQSARPPVDSKQEMEWIKAGRLSAEFARFYPADVADPASRILLHGGTVRWNSYRKRWIMLAGQAFGKPSFLGEIWYSEAKSPLGPFTRAARVVTHDQQSFYNVCHHEFLDRKGGQLIHFEGTYTNEFSGNRDKTPRYNYNQILYRMDLDAPALKAVREP